MVAFVEVALERRPVDARWRVDVVHDRVRDVAVPPPTRRAPPRRLEILVVQEEPLVEEPDVVEVRRAQQHRGTAPREHVGGWSY